MPSLEDLIAILSHQTEDKNTKWTPGWQGVIMVILVLTITVFYESDKMSEFLVNTKEKKMVAEDNGLLSEIEDFLLDKAIQQLAIIHEYKFKIGLGQFQIVENEVLKKLRDDPIALFKSKLEQDKTLDYVTTPIADNKNDIIKTALEKKLNQLPPDKTRQTDNPLTSKKQKTIDKKNPKPDMTDQKQAGKVANKANPKSKAKKKPLDHKSKKQQIQKANQPNNQKSKKLTKKSQKPKLLIDDMKQGKPDQNKLSEKLTKIPKKKNTARKLKPPYRVLMIGDSMMKGEIGRSLFRKITKTSSGKVIQKAVVSSGLAFPQYFDWVKKLKNYIRKYKPNVLIIMVGTNDFHSLYSRDRKTRININKPLWKTEYKKETLRLMKVITNNRLLTFWIGLPIMEKLKLNPRIIKINSVHQQCAAAFDNIHYINIWSLFANKSTIQRYLKNNKGRKVRVRARDGIHLGAYASRLVSQITIKTMTHYMIIN